MKLADKMKKRRRQLYKDLNESSEDDDDSDMEDIVNQAVGGANTAFSRARGSPPKRDK